MSPGGIVVDVDSFVYIAERIPEGRILASVFVFSCLVPLWILGLLNIVKYGLNMVKYGLIHI